MNQTHLVPKILPLFFIFSFAITASYSQTPRELPDGLKIWMNHPASDWNEALPVGNGRLGAMIFGGIHEERLQFNEASVWAGKDEDFVNPQARKALPEVRKLLFEGKYAAAHALTVKSVMGKRKTEAMYQTLGDMNLVFAGNGPATSYRRELDVETAIAEVTYRRNNVLYTREIFSSAPDQGLIVHLTADKPGNISFRVNLNRPGNRAFIKSQGNEIVMTEHVNGGVGVKMVALLKVLNEGGRITIDGPEVSVENADNVTLVLTANTDYWGSDPHTLSQDQAKVLANKQYRDIKEAHIRDYQQYFNRVDLDLGTSEAVYFPTDSRIEAMQAGNTDPQLLELYYQFGRYLLISSSRPGGLPANLQGIWADGLTPPWNADYHININLQMNYWPAELTNLSELHLPLFDFLNALRPDGRKTARDMFGINKGTVSHHTTDPWHFTENEGEPKWAMWPMGLAWCSQHFWEHYLFTGDVQYLRDHSYPAIKESAAFCAEWLVENPHTRELVSGPSISPENSFITPAGDTATMVMGPTMDHMIIRDLFENTIEASKVLNTDAAFRSRLEKLLKKLAPTRIGKDGRILEWTEEFKEPEPGHRHISHLFALHPGNDITTKTPELMKAARKTIDYRLAHGGGHTGWSRAWIINFFARLHDGESAYENLIALINKSTLPNLFDNHPPFQIDGNFGATAGITEMLLQSHAGDIHLLPALPNAWPSGHIKGICARGGFDVDIFWQDGKLEQVKILSKLGNPCQLRYGDKVLDVKTEKGRAYVFNGALERQ